MALTELVETYKFWGVVGMWAKELEADEEIVARVLAKAVIRDGLILNSIDPQLVENKKETKMELRGEPYIGYSGTNGGGMMVLKTDALDHLSAIVRRADKPKKELLQKEFFSKENFRSWLKQVDQEPPVFWFGAKKTNA